MQSRPRANTARRMRAPTNMGSKRKRIVVLILAGLVSVVLTNWGLMAFAFSERDPQSHIADTLFWALPFLSVPVLAVHCVWRRLPTTVFWVLLFCQWASASWLNWESYLRRGGITSNPFLYALSGVVAFPVWCWIVIAALCQYEYHIRSKSSTNAIAAR